MRCGAGIAWWVIVASVALSAAVDLVMDRPSIDAAIALGQSRIERDRERFHAAYRTIVDTPPVDYIDSITPFRSVVLAAESRARIGDRSFGQRQALDMLQTAAAQIDISAEFTFHPLNNYVGVPDYAVSLTDPSGASVQPRAFERIPRFGARVDGTPLLLPIPAGPPAPGPSQPLLGGTVIAKFDGRLLNPSGVYGVVIEEAGKELARVRVDFGTLR